ncbi:hypothetical protein KHA80_03165 [Anaerobacillus sp. HL2]|nr:hypothetical protein KHA80_03165 [Anaerobacillus sp. HL2]
MLNKLDVPPYRTKAIEFVAETFNVTFEFAKKRIERHEQQQIGSLFSLQIKKQYEAEMDFKNSIGFDYFLQDKKKTIFA